MGLMEIELFFWSRFSETYAVYEVYARADG